VVELFRGKSLLLTSVVLAGLLGATLAPAQAAQNSSPPDKSLVVTKVEPPNWWLGLTQDVMVLVSGRGLDANKVECNLSSVLVERTQSTAGGAYLFVWLKFGADMKSGTIVCRITNSDGGIGSFELPVSARTETIHRFQGITPDDVVYLIMPDRFANGDPTNDEPASAPGSHDRAKPRAYHGGDLRVLGRPHAGNRVDFALRGRKQARNAAEAGEQLAGHRERALAAHARSDEERDQLRVRQRLRSLRQQSFAGPLASRPPGHRHTCLGCG